MELIKKEFRSDKGYLLGIRKSDKKKVWLSPASFDCGWYWGFGYLRVYNNRNNLEEHFHFSCYFNKSVSAYDVILQDFKALTVDVKSDLWTLLELIKTYYNLSETAAVLGRGGSHYTDNPLKEIIINKEEVKRINEIVLPGIFEEIYKLLKV